MLAVNQCSTTHVANDCQLKKNGAAKAPACINAIQPTTIQSTLFHCNFSGSHGVHKGSAPEAAPATLVAGTFSGCEYVRLCLAIDERFGVTVDIVLSSKSWRCPVHFHERIRSLDIEPASEALETPNVAAELYTNIGIRVSGFRHLSVKLLSNREVKKKL